MRVGVTCVQLAARADHGACAHDNPCGRAPHEARSCAAVQAQTTDSGRRYL